MLVAILVWLAICTAQTGRPFTQEQLHLGATVLPLPEAINHVTCTRPLHTITNCWVWVASSLECCEGGRPPCVCGMGFGLEDGQHHAPCITCLPAPNATPI